MEPTQILLIHTLLKTIGKSIINNNRRFGRFWKYQTNLAGSDLCDCLVDKSNLVGEILSVNKKNPFVKCEAGHVKLQ